jgi:hypothetical protein
MRAHGCASRGLQAVGPRATLMSMSDELTWDQRILCQIDSGVDITQIRRNLQLTPTERLERMEAMLRDLEEMRGKPRPAGSSSR